MIFEKIRNVRNPERANLNDSWIDFFIPEDLTNDWKWNMLPVDINWKHIIVIYPWESILIPLWIKVKLDYWTDLTFVNKSWIASKTWVIVWACLIDKGYIWELVLNLINTSVEVIEFKLWQKIVQWVIRNVNLSLPMEWIVNDITERWEWWFWSTWI